MCIGSLFLLFWKTGGWAVLYVCTHLYYGLICSPCVITMMTDTDLGFVS